MKKIKPLLTTFISLNLLIDAPSAVAVNINDEVSPSATQPANVNAVISIQPSQPIINERFKIIVTSGQANSQYDVNIVSSNDNNKIVVHYTITTGPDGTGAVDAVALNTQDQLKAQLLLSTTVVNQTSPFAAHQKTVPTKTNTPSASPTNALQEVKQTLKQQSKTNIIVGISLITAVLAAILFFARNQYLKQKKRKHRRRRPSSQS